ncbi:erythromycin esterase family protein [Streptomyces sp. OE57]|uniref:erythromycin esterase family protein n=1 Tax=Streptomyces lacaronensis TaxID=3379885 RepID=UPI0039B76A7A
MDQGSRSSGPVPEPPAEFADAILGGTALDAHLLDPRADSPAPVRAWFATPTRTRLLGPGYDPADDAAHHLSGGSLADWCDAVLHVREVTSARLLSHTRDRAPRHSVSNEHSGRHVAQRNDRS